MVIILDKNKINKGDEMDKTIIYGKDT